MMIYLTSCMKIGCNILQFHCMEYEYICKESDQQAELYDCQRLLFAYTICILGLQRVS